MLLALQCQRFGMGYLETAYFTGKSGTIYPFEIYSLDTAFNNVCAVYIFGRWDIYSGIIFPLYIGETTELAKRLANHEKRLCAMAYGLNCFCIHRVLESLRFQIETDLINGYSNCPCNKQP